MFCVVEKRDERAHMQLQAALLKEMEYLRKSIEQSLSTFEAKIEERTPARSGEASHSRAGEAPTEDLRKEFSSLREHVHRELNGMRSKVAQSTPQPQLKQTKPIKTKTVVTHWWPGRQGGFSPSSGLPIAPGRLQAHRSRESQRR